MSLITITLLLSIKRSHTSECMFEHQYFNVWTILQRMARIHTSEDGPFIGGLSININLAVHQNASHTSELRCMVTEVSSDGRRCGYF